MRPRTAVAVLVSLAGLILVPASVAALPSYAVQGGQGLLTANGTRYVALGTGDRTATMLAAIRAEGGSVVKTMMLRGSFGIPQLGFNADTAAGLSSDGKTLVLLDTVTGNPLKKRSKLAIIDTKRFRMQQTVDLRGDFSFDALSPSGRLLYLVQHVSADDVSQYVVRAYDRYKLQLLPRRISDRTQRDWVMHGFAAARTTSSNGRWVYTLYQNPGGYPFIHALDTVGIKAHCVGVPWPATSKQDAVMNMRLALEGDGRTLALLHPNGRRYLTVDTATWRVSRS